MRIIYRLMVGVSSLSARGAAGARLPARFAPPSVKAFSAVASSAFSTTIIKPQVRAVGLSIRKVDKLDPSRLIVCALCVDFAPECVYLRVLPWIGMEQAL